MKFEDRHEFTKPVATLLKMFSDRSYFERKYQKVGNRDIEVLEHELDGDEFRIKVRYGQVPTLEVPGFAKKFLPNPTIVTQHDRWNLRTRRGRLDIEIRNLPMKIGADMQVSEHGSGSVNTLAWTLSCPVPLIGGKLEQLVGDDIRRQAAGDLRASRELLEGY